MKELIQTMERDFPITKTDHNRENQVFVTISKEKAPQLVTWLKDYQKYTHMAFMTAVDYIERNVFQITYMLHNHDTQTDVGVRVEIDRENPVMTSMHHLWKSIYMYQREMHEMFGIIFPDSPRLEESFILEGWQEIPPMRRDFDTVKYSEETYFPRPGRSTNDPKEYMKEKLYPEKNLHPNDKGGR